MRIIDIYLNSKLGLVCNPIFCATGSPRRKMIGSVVFNFFFCLKQNEHKPRLDHKAFSFLNTNMEVFTCTYLRQANAKDHQTHELYESTLFFYVNCFPKNITTIHAVWASSSQPCVYHTVLLRNELRRRWYELPIDSFL